MREKDQDLGRELQKIWNVKVKIMPLVIGSLGAIPKQFGNRLKQIGITAGTVQVQKTVLLGTAKILRNVLEIYGYWLWLDFNSIIQYSFTVCQLNNNNNYDSNNNNFFLFQVFVLFTMKK